MKSSSLLGIRVTLALKNLIRENLLVSHVRNSHAESAFHGRGFSSEFECKKKNGTGRMERERERKKEEEEEGGLG